MSHIRSTKGGSASGPITLRIGRLSYLETVDNDFVRIVLRPFTDPDKTITFNIQTIAVTLYIIVIH